MSDASNESSSLRYEAPSSDGVGIVWLDIPGAKVNTLTLELLPEFGALMDRILKEGTAKSLVIASGKPAGFVAGANIDVLDTIDTLERGIEISKQGQAAMDRLANAPHSHGCGHSWGLLGRRFGVGIGLHGSGGQPVRQNQTGPS